ncbi:hypothetical protein CU097_006812 [Rhizopus azygosporus]|uniref:Uncharacterized protein n=1 Tax=Rhizopus azygosporus TaxID=86630 RepID=A0A367JR24_RHIAZ|nr:hypothetical protein CU097_006812 [Rhizopus azygosporus]
MDKKQHSNVGDVDDLPPPSYEEVINPPFNPNYSASSSTAQSQPQPPISRPIYPQLPSPPPAVQHHLSSFFLAGFARPCGYLVPAAVQVVETNMKLGGVK